LPARFWLTGRVSLPMEVAGRQACPFVVISGMRLFVSQSGRVGN